MIVRCEVASPHTRCYTNPIIVLEIKNVEELVKSLRHSLKKKRKKREMEAYILR